MAQDSDFTDQVPPSEIAIDAGIRASTALKWKNRDIELMALTENPAFSMVIRPGQNLSTGGAHIPILWDTVFDKGRTGEKFDLVNGRFNPKIPGQYFVEAQVYIQGGTVAANSPAFTSLKVRKNGVASTSNVAVGETSTIDDPTLLNLQLKVSAGIFLDGINDYIDIALVQTTEILVLPGVNSYFHGFRITGLGF